MTMTSVARRMTVVDRSTGLYHRARCVGRVPIFFTDPECEVEQRNLREQKVPADASKRLLHACLFWAEVTV